jgi:hypothetical protein
VLVVKFEEVDGLITRHAEHWRMERMPAVDRNILRLGVYELLYGATPAAVVIDEALELTRRFSGEESVLFVNGVLDAIHRSQPATDLADRRALGIVAVNGRYRDALLGVPAGGRSDPVASRPTDR